MRGEWHEKENRKNGLIDRDDVSTPEPTADTEGTDTGNELEEPEASPKSESGESSNQGTDITQKEQPEAQSTAGTSAQWVDSTPNLEGDAKDLKDGQLTVVEFITEKADNGGARFEMSEATAADLAVGQHIRVWGVLQAMVWKQSLVVFTTVSGSGKSSTVFDTIVVKSQRQRIKLEDYLRKSLQ